MALCQCKVFKRICHYYNNLYYISTYQLTLYAYVA